MLHRDANAPEKDKTVFVLGHMLEAKVHIF
jgi:hypothetical protein